MREWAERGPGVLLALSPALGGLSLLIWLVVALATRYSSLAALVTALAAPVIDACLWGPGLRTAAVGVMSALLIWRHRANIGKLLAGTESRLGSKS